MDFLKAEISKKRKEMESVVSKSSHKYFKRGDLEKEREKAYYEEKERIDCEQLRKKRELLEEEENRRILFKEKYQRSRSENKDDFFSKQISEEELIKKLRDKNQPICLFGETFDDRKRRLLNLELAEERKKNQDKTSENLQSQEKIIQQSKEDAEALKKEATSNPSVLDINLNELKNNPELYFELLIELWKKTLEERPDDIKESKQGKSVSENQQKSQKDLQKKNYEK
ncbi:hypothetical protein PCK2_000248 [Pneumocystis canis]|nr:hypothetical protein PCK2_000248 [Pneumocystis canis]